MPKNTTIQENESDNNKNKKKILQTAEKISKEIEEYAKDPSLGISDETMMAFIGDRKWKLNPLGHTKSIRDIIKKDYLEIIQIITNQQTQIDVISNIDKIDNLTKKILEMGLDDTFNYDKSAEDIDIGPAQLRLLAQEIGNFLVVQGGKGASRHLQTLQKLNQFNLLTSSNITQV